MNKSHGILSVSAEGKGTGKYEKIRIGNSEGRLSEEQMEKMITEAISEQFEDRKVKDRVDAKNAFDDYLHFMRLAVEGSGEDQGLSQKLGSEEKDNILDALKDGQSWNDSSPEADAEQVEEKREEVEAICAHIISKHYGGGCGGGKAGGGEEEAHDDEL